MATIGSLQYDKKRNVYAGRLNTLSIKAPIELIPSHKDKETQPDYRIVSEGVEVGAAWIRQSKNDGREYVSLSIEAPEFGRTRLYANLGKMPGQDDPNVFAIIWNAEDSR